MRHREALGLGALAVVLAVGISPVAAATGAVQPTARTAAPAAKQTGRAAAASSELRVMTYNSLDASFDGQEHPGGRSAPFSKRLPKQLHLIRHSGAAVIGIEEGNACLHSVPHSQCWRQIDALNRGLPHFRLAKSVAADYYHGNYVLYRPDLLTPIGTGGGWATGPRHPAADNRYAEYQRFQIKGTSTRFLFVVVHTFAPAGHANDVIRGQEAQETVDKASAYARRHHLSSVIYVGDFNSYRGEYHVDDLSGQVMRKAGLHDGIAVAHRLVDAKYDSINALYRRPRSGHGSADHIYVTPGIKVKTWGELLDLVHGEFSGAIPSDHNPVYADVVIPAG